MNSTNLKPLAVDFGGEKRYLEQCLPQYPEAASICDIMLAEARVRLLGVIAADLDLDPENAANMATIDAMIEAHDLLFRRAISRLQLTELYRDQGNADRVEVYSKEFDDERRAFKAALRRTLDASSTLDQSQGTRSATYTQYS